MASKGLQGYPHYRNSTPAMQEYEPLYLNLFSVQITPPGAVKGDPKLVIENVISVSGIEVEQTPDTVEQIYKGARRRYAGALPASTVANPTLNFEVNLNDSNQAYVYNFLRAWCDLVWNPLTGGMQLKKDYIGENMIISQYNKVGNVYRRIIFHDIFPKVNLTIPELNYTGGQEIFKATMTFASDYWDDVSAS